MEGRGRASPQLALGPKLQFMLKYRSGFPKVRRHVWGGVYGNVGEDLGFGFGWMYDAVEIYLKSPRANFPKVYSLQSRIPSLALIILLTQTLYLFRKLFRVTSAFSIINTIKSGTSIAAFLF